jgi:hypothetical protein
MKSHESNDSLHVSSSMVLLQSPGDNI